MLENLDKIEWEKLQHAYGSAKDVPDLIRKLANDAAQVCSKAADQLSNSICHAGFLTPCVIYTLPFLIELLHYNFVLHKDSILEVLYDLALSNGSLEQIEMTQEGIHKGLSVYLDLLTDPKPRTRQKTVELLCTFSDHAPELFPVIWSAIEKEKDVQTKASMLLALGDNFLQKKPEYAPFLEKVIKSDESKLVRIHAAVALAYITTNKTIPEAVELIVEGYATLNQPLMGIGGAIKSLGPDKAIPAILKILELTVNKSKLHSLIRILLGLSFDENKIFLSNYSTHHNDDGVTCSYSYKIFDKTGGATRMYSGYREVIPKRRLEELTSEQKRVLKALLNIDNFWEYQKNLLEFHGLPNSRDALRLFLAGQ